jgi:hypothetical protein
VFLHLRFSYCLVSNYYILPYNIANPAANPPTNTPTAPGKFTTPAPVSAGTVALALLDLLLVVERAVLLLDIVNCVELCVEECDGDVVVEFLDNVLEESVALATDVMTAEERSEVSEGYTIALGPKYGASEGLKRGPLAMSIISI